MSRSRYRLVFGAGILVLGLSMLAYFAAQRQDFPAWSPGALLNNAAESDHIDGQVFTIKDNSDNVLSKMSRSVNVGDELIQADGRRYRVKTVNKFDARAEFAGMDRELLAMIDEFSSLALPTAGQTGQTGDQDWKNRPVAIYHTHSAESYVPTDGTESKPYHGGIFEVGDVFAEALRNKGVKVLHDKTPHEPRDSNAYYRSRRTVADLMKQNPVALIDVHRDGIPDPAYYTKSIAGDAVTQLRLVVGRQNPKMQSNMEFAKKVMAAANKVHQGIVKEIFVARGNYNQDLMSSAMLIEAGTHTNTREEAEKGAALFADALPAILGIGGTTPGNEGFGTTSKTPGGWATIAWILGVLILGGGAFLLISSGGWDKARQRLRSFWGQEFSGLGSPAKKPGDGNHDKPDGK